MDDSAILAEMAEEFAARWRRGERPGIEEYAARAPALAERVRALFPTLMLLEGLAAGGAPVEEAPRSEMPRPGETFGAYRVGPEIGRGGMGVVYEAEHLVLHRRVALKVLPLRGGDAGARLERFLREARTAASLHHGNIVPVFDVGQVNGTPYYAMQRIDGVSLDRLGHGSGVPTAAEGQGVPQSAEAPGGPAVTVPEGAERFRWAAEVGRQAAEGLAHAHQRGVVHRDVKPSNLMIDGQGVVWVTDFGLAKRLEEDAALTASGQVIGTPRYASPEQAAASKRPIDHRTDVYSLGATLYELVTRRPAFDGPTPLDVLLSIIERQPVPPRQLDPSVPRDLETVILKAMSKRPEDRYQTAHEMAEDLRRFLDGEPVRARRIGVVGRAVRWARRNPALAAMAALVWLSLTAGVIASTLFALHADEQRRRANGRAEAEAAARLEAAGNLYVAQASLAATAWRDGEDDRVRTLLERMCPAAGQPDRRGWEWHFFDRQVNGKSDGRLAALAAGKGVSHYPAFFSSDARRVVLNAPPTDNEKGWLEILDADTGRLIGRRLVKGHATFRDDAKAAAWRDGDRVIVWDVDADRTSAHHAPGGALLALCPLGGRLALDAPKGDRIDLLDLKTGQSLRIPFAAAFSEPLGGVQFSPDGKWLARTEFTDLRTESVSRRGRVTVWDADSGRLRLRVEAEAVALGRDGKVVLAEGPLLRLYGLASAGRPVPVATGEAKAPWVNFRLSGDGAWLAALNQDDQVWLFSTDDSRPPRRVRPRGEPHDFAFRSPSLLRTLGRDAGLEEFDLSECDRQWFPAADQYAARDAGGTRLAFACLSARSGTAPPRVDVFGADGRRLLRAPLPRRCYYHAATSLDAAGKAVAWAGFHSPFFGPEDTVVVDAEGDPREALGRSLSLAVPAGGLPELVRLALVLGSPYGHCDVEIRAVDTGRVLLRESVADGPAGPLWGRGELSPDGHHYLLGLGRPVVWDVASGRRLALPLGEEVKAACFVPGGRLAAVSGDGTRLWADLWELAGPRRLWRVDVGEENPGPGRRIVHLRADGDVLAFFVDWTSVRCLSLGDGASLIHEAVPSGEGGTALALGGSRLAVGAGRRLVVWDTSTAERVLSRDEGAGDSWTPALLPGGRMALVCLKQRGVHVRLLDQRGEQFATLSLPRRQGQTREPPTAPDVWTSGHKLHVLYRATADTWELHTLDGTPR